MKAALTTTALAVFTLLSASSANATDYAKVGNKAKQGMQTASAVWELIDQIPAPYNGFKQPLRSLAGVGTQNGYDIWMAVEQQDPESIHNSLLAKARAAENAMDDLQDLAKSLKREADDDDNGAVENLAKSIKRKAKDAEKLFRNVRRELD